MARDSLLPVRRAMLTVMKADAGLIALVPAARIYPQSPPASPEWPFVKTGSPSGVPLRASCIDGMEVICAVHAFSKGRRTGKRLIETAEDHAARIGAAIAAALDGQKIEIAAGAATIKWTGSQLLQDRDEAGAFHTIQNFRARCLTS